ncbi:major facilitator superfamily domain-containing protein [Mycena amicta]|nr:major facilitator superfamily domain-containing protein [Mycena amicta]
MDMSSSHSPAASSVEKRGDDGDMTRATQLEAQALATRRLVRKLDMRLLPCLALAYILAFIDRANAGNARVSGLTKDVDLGNWGFNIGTSLYYILYFLCEIPAVILVRRFGNHLVPAAIIVFGIITLATGFIHTRGQFYAVKSLLGIAEAFVLPGNAYIVTQFYTRSETSARIGVFIFSGGFLSGAFGGLLAFGFLHVKPIGQLHTWRHIFAWEGIITIGLGALLFLIYPSRPHTTRMLTEDERSLTIRRLGLDNNDKAQFPSWRQVKIVLLDPVVLASACFYVINNVTVTGMSVFTPTILALNYPHASAVQIQLLAVPPNICAWAFSLILITLAMRYGKHGLAALIGALLTVVGYATWLATNSSFVKTRYACIFLNTMGGCYGPIILAWAVSNARGDSARALTGATVPGLGALGSIVGSWTYFPNDAKTGYHVGNTLNVSLASFVAVGISALWIFEFLMNQRSVSSEEKEEGDGHGHVEGFKYVL